MNHELIIKCSIIKNKAICRFLLLKMQLLLHHFRHDCMVMRLKIVTHSWKVKKQSSISYSVPPQSVVYWPSPLLCRSLTNYWRSQKSTYCIIYRNQMTSALYKAVGWVVFFCTLYPIMCVCVHVLWKGTCVTCKHCRQSTWGGTCVPEQRPLLPWWRCHSGHSAYHTGADSLPCRCTRPSSGRSQIVLNRICTLWTEWWEKVKVGHWKHKGI